MGKMDAVAFRPEKSEVLIVDWKTSTQKGTESLETWWDKAGNFGDALYQTLVYRELLTKHLKRSTEVDIKVGVMLVPYHQSNEELLVPGSCVDFSQLEMAGLLSGLKQYRWVCHESELVHTINFPGCKMFKKLEELNELQCVDEETDLLKEGILLKDVISDDATIRVLREELGLLPLKVTSEVENEGEEETRVEGRDGEDGVSGGKGGRGRERRANEVGDGVGRSGGEGEKLALELGLVLVWFGVGVGLGLGVRAGVGLGSGLGLVWLGVGVGLGLGLGLGSGLGLRVGVGLGVGVGVGVWVGSGLGLGFVGLGLGIGVGLGLGLGLGLELR